MSRRPMPTFQMRRLGPGWHLGRQLSFCALLSTVLKARSCQDSVGALMEPLQQPIRDIRGDQEPPQGRHESCELGGA